MDNIPENDAIKWSGTRYGFKPDIPHLVEAIINNKEIDRLDILEAIHDIHKFITAHVILTYTGNIEYETFPTWNNLKIDILQNGETFIDTGQRFFLFDYWKDILKKGS